MNCRKDLSVLGMGAKIDEMAKKLMPADVPEGLKVPVDIMADSDCLPHCGSLALFGSQLYDIEVRLRIEMELILHEDLYLDDTFLSRGHENATSAKMAMYSDEFVPEQTLDIRAIFRREVTSILEKRAYCEI